MEYKQASQKDLITIVSLVQETIQAIYPKYYPKEVVDFFCELHCEKAIAKDIEDGLVGVLLVDGTIVATGCYREHHITRVYVKPEYQGHGYGNYIMQCLEDKIKESYDTVELDASLPASRFYERRGYQTKKHDRHYVEHGVVLVYEIMEKTLPSSNCSICYDGRFFVSKSNTANGEVNGETLFAYHQKNDIVWAEYAGGEIIKGSLLGIVAQNGELNFYYQHINAQGSMRIGVCHSVPHIMEDGKIELHEQWQWLHEDSSKGESILCEQ